MSHTIKVAFQFSFDCFNSYFAKFSFVLGRRLGYCHEILEECVLGRDDVLHPRMIVSYF